MIRLPATRRRRIMLTPLIDVVFLLVMFFMLSSTFVPLRRLDVGIASGSTASGAAQAEDKRTLFLTVGAAPGADGVAASLDGAAVPPGGLEAALRARAGSDDVQVLLQMRSGTDVQDLVTALEAVRAARIGAVRVLTR
ncbi:ExbD/TolR family protein [Antarcticirhabdus aurantiaca]|uniref:Biopolymer transporter ExbD n=1 Tax=Antarcticirhabdus aurantiaca TaxID=2606717 RepID=A0ACD4NV85_9HYPH|nr:biopolymer transporter ExbD [Antarcticirhabdus aurantiaca]WAJ30795.1 biopolymer transporter ExbD [Jeongeuplla avenae]